MSGPAKSTVPPEWVHAGPAFCHHPVLAFLILTVLGEGVRLSLHLNFDREWSWVPSTVWPIAALSLLVGLARRLPEQSMVAAAAIGGGMLFGADWLNGQSGIPFGPRQFVAPILGETGFVPPWMPCLWLTLLLMSRGVARLILKRHRDLEYYGLWVLGLSACLVTMELWLLETVARYLEWWRWGESRSWTIGGTPVVYWLGSWTVSLLTLAFLTPWLLNKRPIPQPIDFHPVWVWMLVAFWIGEHQWAAHDRVGLFANAFICLGIIYAVVRGLALKSADQR